MDIAFLWIGISIGALSIYLFTLSRLKQNTELKENLDLRTLELNQVKESHILLDQNNKVLESQLDHAQDDISNLRFSEDQLKQQQIELNNSNAILKTEHKNLEEKLKTQTSELENLNTKFTTEFENIAHRLFESNREKIKQEGSEQLSHILKPFKENLFDLKSQISNTYEKDTEQRIRLQEQVKQLFDLNQKISTDAQNLTQALKSNSKIQGDWGEEILENILQQSGLRKTFEYDVQNSYTDEKGKSFRPDMIIHYPDQRDIIIDSKVSLTDYERYTSASTKEAKEAALKGHIVSLKQHIKELSEKNYQDLYAIKTLDFVMMFVPIEGAYYIAIEKDRALWQYAYEKKIVLINPTNLITALKMISNLWQQDAQNKNVLEIAQQSGRLYDSFVLLLEDFSKMEKKLGETQDLFHNVKKRISTGKGNLIGKIETIKTLGAKTKKSLPEPYKDAIES